MKFLAILALCILAAIVYGIVHDQVTARICIEYFTIGHHPIGTSSPTLVALYWGVIATWWVGAALGVLIAGVARWGRPPRVEPSEVILPILYLLLFVGAMAIAAGIAGGIAASNGWVRLVGDMRERVPPGRHTAFLIDLWAHGASYAAGAVGGVFLAGWIAGRRSEHRRLTSTGVVHEPPATPAAH